MVYSPVRAPSLFGDPDSFQEPPLISREHPQAQFAPVADPQSVLSYLRETIEAGTSSLDENLKAISEAAQLLTGATGAAVALMRNGSVICVGRSGETAPPLGARLSLDSGISGECLRTGTLLRCDDAFENEIADAEVCRELGLRSIVALPLHRSTGARVVGTLEAFSSRPHAFSEEQVYFLTRLSELAEVAEQREYSIEQGYGREIESEEFHSAPVAGLPAVVQNAPALPQRHASVGEYIREYWAMAAAIVALVAVIGSWVLRPGPAKPPVKRSSSTPTQPAPPSPSFRAPDGSASVGAALSYKPSPARLVQSNRGGAYRGTPGPSPPRSPVADTVVRRVVTDAEKARYSTLPVEANQVTPRQQTSNTVPAPESTASITTSPAPDLVSATPTLPELSPPVSQGMRGGTLDRKVLPIYPRQALETRVEGDVVLEATVSENGQVQDVVIISGHPLLAGAAVDAVNKWHYRPYLLNGEPVRKQTRITVTFKLPN
jgi:TonB family protein